MQKDEIEQIPISKIFDTKDEKDASAAADEMVRLGFLDEKKGFKVIMPKESRLAKRIGYMGRRAWSLKWANANPR